MSAVGGRSRSIAAGVIAVIATLALGACGGGSSKSSAPSSTTTPPTTATPTLRFEDVSPGCKIAAAQYVGSFSKATGTTVAPSQKAKLEQLLHATLEQCHTESEWGVAVNHYMPSGQLLFGAVFEGACQRLKFVPAGCKSLG